MSGRSCAGHEGARGTLRSPGLRQSLVDQLPHLVGDAAPLRRRLHHDDDEQIVGGIDEEERSADAVPAIFASRPRRLLNKKHRESQAETALRARKVKIITTNSRRQDMIL